MGLQNLILGLFMLVEDILVWIAGKLGVPFIIVIFGIIALIIFHRQIMSWILRLVMFIKAVLRL